MKGVKVMECHSSKVPTLGDLTKNYYHHVFGPELTQELVDIFGRDAKYLIREFLFGLDCLVEIIHNPDTPMKKFLNNEDVDVRLLMLTQHRARTENKPEYYGCQVSPAIAEVIAEFFEHKYLRIFTYVLDKLRPHLLISIDGTQYLLHINKEWSTATSTSVLYFREMGAEDRRISIPFKRKRSLV